MRSAVMALACTLSALALGPAPSGPPYAAPETLSHFRIEPGFRIELVAAEPDVQSPIAMDIDERGRWFVVEMPGYPLDTRPTGRIRLLEDTDGDGRPNRSTIFADNLVLPSGVMRWKRGVIVTSAPDVLYLEDTDGDGKADRREVLVTGFARTNPQHMVNTPVFGLDGWIYLAHEGPAGAVIYTDLFGDMGRPLTLPGWPDHAPVDEGRRSVRFNPDTGALEALAGRSQYGEAFDPWGRYFGSNNSNHIRMEMLAARYLQRNPDAPLSWGMADISDHGEAAKVFPITERPTFELLTEAGEFTSACSVTPYTGDVFDGEYRRSTFVAEPVHNLVHRDVIEPDGGGFRARRGSEGREFLASTDAWFRPVSFYVGPDGALYVIDYYRKRIEHPEWTATEFQQNPAEFALGADRGRIYRIVPDGLGGAVRPRRSRRRGQRVPGERAVQRDALVEADGRAAAHRAEGARPDRCAYRTCKKRITAWKASRALDAERARPSARRADHGRARRPRARPARERAAACRAEADHAGRGLGRPRARERRDGSACPLPAGRDARIAAGRRGGGRADAAAVRSPRRFLDRSGGAERRIGSRAGRISTGRSILRQAPSRRTRRRGAVSSTTSACSLAHADRIRRSPVRSAARARGGAPRCSRVSGRVSRDIRPLRSPGLAARCSPSRRPMTPRSGGRRSACWRAGGCPAAAESEAALDLASRTAVDSAADADRRADAIRLLAIDGAALRRAMLERLVRPREPEAVQIAALNALEGLRGDTVGRELLASWPELTPGARTALVDLLLADPARQRLLVDAMSRGIVQPWALNFWQKRDLLMNDDPAIRRDARALLEESPAARGEIANRYAAAVEGGGDPTRGQQVFARVCAACHHLGGGTDADVGPDLATVRHRPPLSLLVDILSPSQSIAQGYERTWSSLPAGAQRRARSRRNRRRRSRCGRPRRRFPFSAVTSNG